VESSPLLLVHGDIPFRADQAFSTFLSVQLQALAARGHKPISIKD